jgi:hypothetical protein
MNAEIYPEMFIFGNFKLVTIQSRFLKTMVFALVIKVEHSPREFDLVSLNNVSTNHSILGLELVDLSITCLYNEEV